MTSPLVKVQCRRPVCDIIIIIIIIIIVIIRQFLHHQRTWTCFCVSSQTRWHQQLHRRATCRDWRADQSSEDVVHHSDVICSLTYLCLSVSGHCRWNQTHPDFNPLVSDTRLIVTCMKRNNLPVTFQSALMLFLLAIWSEVVHRRRDVKDKEDADTDRLIRAGEATGNKTMHQHKSVHVLIVGSSALAGCCTVYQLQLVRFRFEHVFFRLCCWVVFGVHHS